MKMRKNTSCRCQSRPHILKYMKTKPKKGKLKCVKEKDTAYASNKTYISSIVGCVVEKKNKEEKEDLCRSLDIILQG